MEKGVSAVGTGSSSPEGGGGVTASPPDPLPPANPPPRQNLVELAVKFLNNPRVAERPLEDKKAFLRKKGLTDAEIDAAISKSAQEPHPSTALAVSNGNGPPLPPRPLTYPHPPPQSRTWSEYAIMAAVVGGVGYAVIHFIRSYVIPWFNAPRAQERKQLEDIHASVNQLQTTVSETISAVAESTKSIRELLAEQQQHIQLLTSQVTGLQAALANDQPLRQLKEELGSLKGIMLSRHQFPPTPTRGGNGGGIPAWQRAAVSQDSPKKPAEQDEEVKLSTEDNGNETALQNGTGEENSPDEC